MRILYENIGLGTQRCPGYSILIDYLDFILNFVFSFFFHIKVDTLKLESQNQAIQNITVVLTKLY